MGSLLTTTSLIYILLCPSLAIRTISINGHPLNANISKKFKVGPGWDWILPNDPKLRKRKVTAECVTTIKNATFNLLPLHLSSKFKGQLKYYSVKDERSVEDPTDDYEYAFNVCGPVLEIPEGCANAGGNYCEDNNFTTTAEGNVYISQDINGTQYCPPDSWKEVGTDKGMQYD